MSQAAKAKADFLKHNLLGYILSAVLAGMYIGFGVLLSNTIGASMSGSPAQKLASGASFGIALSLVVMCGAELFTGNNMVMAAGLQKKTVKIKDAVSLWCVCWLGNLGGGILLGVLYHFTNLASGDTGTYMATAAVAKMGAGAGALFCRGILCNMLVCLAVWTTFRTKSDAAKLMMVWWCLFAFVATGFEHSVANMTLFTVALLDPAGQAVTLGGAVYNLVLVTAGNMVGGIFFVAAPYLIGQKQEDKIQ